MTHRHQALKLLRQKTLPAHRPFHSTPPRWATPTEAEANTLAFNEPEAITISPIFDIFDAPVRLGESRPSPSHNRLMKKTLGTSSSSLKAATSSYSPSSSSSSSSSPSPSSPAPTTSPSRVAPLPPPIIFDGPARPKNPALALRSRTRPRIPAGPSTMTATGARKHHTPSTGTLFMTSTGPVRHQLELEGSEPLVQWFDGPARITRYAHNPSAKTKDRQSLSRHMIMLSLAGGVGLITLSEVAV